MTEAHSVVMLETKKTRNLDTALVLAAGTLVLANIAIHVASQAPTAPITTYSAPILNDATLLASNDPVPAATPAPMVVKPIVAPPKAAPKTVIVRKSNPKPAPATYSGTVAFNVDTNGYGNAYDPTTSSDSGQSGGPGANGPSNGRTSRGQGQGRQGFGQGGFGQVGQTGQGFAQDDGGGPGGFGGPPNGGFGGPGGGPGGPGGFGPDGGPGGPGGGPGGPPPDLGG